jgi:hypothetical protein
LAILITCNGANRGDVGEPVDLFGVGEVHGRDFIVYVEIDEWDLDQALASGLALEAEGLQTGQGSTRLLLREIGAGSVELLSQKLLWGLPQFPTGTWRLSVRVERTEVAYRVISVGDY